MGRCKTCDFNGCAFGQCSGVCNVDQVRRAWLTAGDVLNTWPLAELRKVLKRSTSPKLTYIKAAGGSWLEKDLLQVKA